MLVTIYKLSDSARRLYSYIRLFEVKPPAKLIHIKLNMHMLQVATMLTLAGTVARRALKKYDIHQSRI